MKPVGVQAVADALQITPRRVQQLVDEGMPRIEQGRYDLGACVGWYLERKVEESRRDTVPTDFDAAKARKMAAEAALAEHELARAESQVVTLDVMERELSSALYRLRAKMLNLPSKWAPSLVGCRTVVEAQTRLEAAVGEAMLSLSETGEEEDGDEAERAA